MQNLLELHKTVVLFFFIFLSKNKIFFVDNVNNFVYNLIFCIFSAFEMWITLKSQYISFCKPFLRTLKSLCTFHKFHAERDSKKFYEKENCLSYATKHDFRSKWARHVANLIVAKCRRLFAKQRRLPKGFAPYERQLSFSYTLANLFCVKFDAKQYIALYCYNALLRIRYFHRIRNEAYVYMKSDLSSCRRYLMSKPLYWRVRI
jgi:hypothetical protein